MGWIDVLRGFPEILLRKIEILENINHSLIKINAAAKRSGARGSTNLEVVGPVPLPVVSAVVGHHVLGHQHALVRDTSVAAVSKLIHEAA